MATRSPEHGRAARPPGSSSKQPGRSERPRTIDAYLEGVADPRQRAALTRLRKTLRAIAPKAVECISYGLPAFRLEGRVIAGFAAGKRGCSYYPFSGTTLTTLAAELEGYEKTRSALHFDPGAPLPAALVRKLVRARLAEG